MSIITDENKREIFYNIVNSLLAGALVFLGAFVNGGMSWKGFAAALLASFVVALTNFKEYWDSEKAEYSQTKLFTFIK